MSLTGKVHGKTLQGNINRLYELRGYSAYEVAVLNGFAGTEEEWLESIKGGPKGDTGNSGVYVGSGDMPADCNVQIDPNGDALNIDDVYAHIEDTQNPHGVTAEQIGAAPAIESTEYPGCYYRIVNDETEWVNPPMVIGVSYRTTERHDGKPVYITAAQLDLSLSDPAHVTLANGINQVVSIDGTVQLDNRSTRPIAGYNDHFSINIYGNFIANGVRINAVAYPVVKYTK